MSIKLDWKYLSPFIDSVEYELIQPQIDISHNLLHFNSGKPKFNELTGWLNLPTEYKKSELDKIKSIADKINKNTDIFIVIGIGGSYLGAKAAIDFLNSPNYNFLKKSTPNVFFVGNNINSDSIFEILEICKEKDVSVNVISKSGKTLETSIAFRIFKNFLEKKYGKAESKKRIYCTTDKNNGLLRKIADYEGYETLDIPKNIGGRYSVLTAVGLLPIAVCGGNIYKIIEGAARAQIDFLDKDLNNNDCYKYAAIRNILNRKGKLIEILIGYHTRLSGLTEWWKQLFAESEGKNNKGIFPASNIFSTDLHSMGQFIQEGSKILFETTINLNKSKNSIKIDFDKENLDDLNYLINMSMDYINQKAFEGTIFAHTEGNIPNIVINMDEISEYNLGYIIYFFEKACAISGYILGVDPFNQPGVEVYKKNMMNLLNKINQWSGKLSYIKI